MPAGRPRIPDEIKRQRGTFRPSRSAPSANGTLCPILQRKYETALRLCPTDPDFTAAYHEVLEMIDANHEHVDGCHGILTGPELEAVEELEELIRQMLDTIGATRDIYNALEMHYTKLCRLAQGELICEPSPVYALDDPRAWEGPWDD